MNSKQSDEYSTIYVNRKYEARQTGNQQANKYL